jgi:hypothetical protein
MARIYLGLALVAMALLLTNLALGLWTGPYGETAAQMVDAGRKFNLLEREVQAGRLAKDAPQVAEQKQAFDEAVAAWQTLKPRTITHMLLGIAAALVAMLVNSISVTYFIGTSRWCREVVEAYHLNPSYIEQSLQLKRRTFPWALSGMLVIIVLVAFGALSDPGANFASHLQWRLYHFLMAVVGTCFLGLAFYVQQQNVGANYRIIEQILAEVRRVRQARGLDVEEANA